MDDLVFNVDDITVEDVEDFLVAAGDNQLRRQAEIMARYVVTLPKGWSGDGGEVFSKRPFREFKAVREKFLQALNDMSKN